MANNDNSGKALAYKVNELSEILGIGRNAAYELCRRPDFPSIRIGNRIVVPVDALNKWLEDQVKNQQADPSRGLTGRGEVSHEPL